MQTMTMKHQFLTMICHDIDSDSHGFPENSSISMMNRNVSTYLGDCPWESAPVTGRGLDGGFGALPSTRLTATAGGQEMGAEGKVWRLQVD